MIQEAVILFYFDLIKNTMPENKAFSEEEDQLIRHLYEEMRIKKWGMIAKTLTEDYNFPRNAKQCRDRYLHPLFKGTSSFSILRCRPSGLRKSRPTCILCTTRLAISGP